MDFARKQMEKYGWKEGEGLGKNNSGIAKPIKPKLKFNTAGLGHDQFLEIHDSWWERVYDEAAKNLSTKKISEESGAKESDSVAVNINKKKLGIKKKTEGMYNGFIKTSELVNNRENKINEDSKRISKQKKKRKKDKSSISSLTEEELFQICEGRTIHKGARHGLNLNGKLARLQQQEYSLLNHNVCLCEQVKDAAAVKGSETSQDEDKKFQFMSANSPKIFTNKNLIHNNCKNLKSLRKKCLKI